MKLKKHLALALSLVLCASMLAGCGSDGSTPQAPAGDETDAVKTSTGTPDKVYEWRFQSTENESIAMYRERDEICKKIAEETNGGLIITQYTGGAIISDMNIPDAVMTRTVEMGNVYLNPLYASVPTANMVGITPGFLWNVAECMLFMKGYGALDIFADECETNLNSYVYPELTGRAVYLSTKPLKETKDFQGLSIKAYGPLGNIFTKLGASVVTLSSNEIYTSLQTGLCQAANWGAYEGAYGSSLHEVCDYIIEPAAGIGIGTVNLVNKDAYDELPEEYQAVFDKYFSDRMYDSFLGTEESEYESRQAMLDAGLEVCTLSEDCQNTFREMALVEMEELSKANEACGQIYDQMMLYLEHSDSLHWK